MRQDVSKILLLSLVVLWLYQYFWLYSLLRERIISKLCGGSALESASSYPWPCSTFVSACWAPSSTKKVLSKVRFLFRYQSSTCLCTIFLRSCSICTCYQTVLEATDWDMWSMVSARLNGERRGDTETFTRFLYDFVWVSEFQTTRKLTHLTRLRFRMESFRGRLYRA